MVWALFGSLWGHCSLQTASEVKSDLRFKISDPNYLLIHVHVVDMVGALVGSLWGHYSLQTASEVKNWGCRWNWWPKFTIWPSFKVSLLVQKWLCGQEEEENHRPLTCVALPQATRGNVGNSKPAKQNLRITHLSNWVERLPPIFRQMRQNLALPWTQ